MVKQIARCVSFSFVLTLAVGAVAQAQPWEDKMYVNANLGFDLTSRSFTESVAPVIYDERAAITTTHNIDSGFTPIDVEGGLRIWRSVGIGGGFTRRAQTETATVDARVPHPTLFGQPRFATLSTPLQHTEWAIHLHAVYVVPISPRLDLALRGGPSYFSISQDLVTNIQIAEESPTFATVSIAKIGSTSHTEYTFGYSAAGDVTFFLTRMLGVGATIRYVSASVDFPVAGGGTATYDAGGLQLAFGVRIRMR
ncbi:MAG TPA: outer membrane beta-barrel protein [Vicinamibacterales bacterium]|nr:outer membrane beta-barrel protein [Vicinamibacterales bacterium]